jgi:hypothetical protein
VNYQAYQYFSVFRHLLKIPTDGCALLQNRKTVKLSNGEEFYALPNKEVSGFASKVFER